MIEPLALAADYVDSYVATVPDTKLFVSTTVRYRDLRGRLYFTFVRPVHGVLAPFMVSVMIRQAGGGAS